MSVLLENKGNPTIPAPLAFASWLASNGEKLQPPVNNYCLYTGDDFILMVVGGPNKRNDFHVNEMEEWFYLPSQLDGVRRSWHSCLFRQQSTTLWRDSHGG